MFLKLVNNLFLYNIFYFDSDFIALSFNWILKLCSIKTSSRIISICFLVSIYSQLNKSKIMVTHNQINPDNKYFKFKLAGYLKTIGTGICTIKKP